MELELQPYCPLLLLYSVNSYLLGVFMNRTDIVNKPDGVLALLGFLKCLAILLFPGDTGIVRRALSPEETCEDCPLLGVEGGWGGSRHCHLRGGQGADAVLPQKTIQGCRVPCLP